MMSAATLEQPKPRSRRDRSLGQIPWAVADQLTVSATNFATMVLLARSLSVQEFGVFSLGYSALLFANSLQSGLITQPHNVLGATRTGRDYARYTATTAFGQTILVAALVAVVLTVWGAAAAWSWEGEPMLATLAPSIAAWQFQEFSRRVLYTEGRLAGAFWNDLISYGGQTAVIFALMTTGNLTGPTAMAALAFTSALGALLGAWQLRGSVQWPIDRDALRETWNFGKWLAGAELVGTWLSSQILVYLAALTLGAAAAGVLRAVHTIFGPMRILAYALNSLLPVRFAKALAAEGHNRLQREFRNANFMAVPLLGGYCLLVMVFAGPLLKLLYGDRYNDEKLTIIIYSVMMFLTYITMIISTAIQAMRQGRWLFTCQVYTSLLTIPIGWALILLLGVDGVVLGTTLSALVMCGLSLLAYRQGIAALNESHKSDFEVI